VLRRELDQQRLAAAVAQQELDGFTGRLQEVCVPCVRPTAEAATLL
jgi:hypothetical protein